MNQPLVVIAEDDRDVRELLTFALENAGYRTVAARDGATAARLVATAGPAALITDVRMPDMNGMDLCRLVRRSPATRDLAILMFSASIHPLRRRRGPGRRRRPLPAQAAGPAPHPRRTARRADRRPHRPPARPPGRPGRRGLLPGRHVSAGWPAGCRCG
ncbi:response regulator [Actinoplanes oblitus]|uniref:Response regulator n=1 Tax=Actinoplanes oblitus TaxID=3040509 RepID=A0ABY8W3N2_9ACTN|nr:response regulator [Actinoplanes oblitus]WIM92464.1 response regulator [Actinoplanes oblitus]